MAELHPDVVADIMTNEINDFRIEPGHEHRWCGCSKNDATDGWWPCDYHLGMDDGVRLAEIREGGGHIVEQVKGVVRRRRLFRRSRDSGWVVKLTVTSDGVAESVTGKGATIGEATDEALTQLSAKPDGSGD